jgi:hypothetical protein
MDSATEQIAFPKITPAPTTISEWAAYVGMGEPIPRGAALAVVGTAACYALKFPSVCFKDDGVIKKFDISPDEDDEERTQIHFVLVPLAFFVAGYLFL